ncbi:Trehalase [Actinomadura rubteroloni]|uniref:Trehalase n=1 Tax=Actinomadura rubteroloni TaxID=1926885 RepID=A0A2P4UGQ5_9ACTN|nr:glycoside hydrolase family 15 protein [Actinomadura rubteroloni]POM24252.1 Trehalase [Actinomadura rubteroloni]
MSPPPLGAYAFLSDCRTAALLGPDGAVEWWCAPRFDAPAVFNRILDRRIGGAFELLVEGAGEPSRRYVGTSLVLESRWEGPSGTVVARDFLAVRAPEAGDGRGIVPVGVLVRRVTCEQGTARIRARVCATPDHARTPPRWTAVDGALAESASGLVLGGDPAPVLRGEPCLDVVLDEGDVAELRLAYGDPALARAPAGPLLDATLGAWEAWSSRSGYDGVGAEHVRRSAVVLRGLLDSESGALLAAPTASLPEWPGGERNWDYRYVWHRDAALVVLVLLRLGHPEEAGRYLRFLLRNWSSEHGHLRPMLTLDGGMRVAEETLDHLEGYAGSRPVRIGNEAFDQVQLDVYGQVLDAALVYQQVAGDLTPDEAAGLFAVVDAACARWREPDHGIWEVRTRLRHWTSSKLYAWVCLDRGVRLAAALGDERPPLDRWRSERDAVRESLLTHGYHPGVGAFTQVYGEPELDASLLRLPLLGFLDGRDPRVRATLDRIDERLGEPLAGGGRLIHRYDPGATGDGLDGPEGAFLLCSFDMVSALVLAGRTDDARRRFAALCPRGGPLGLFAEEMTGDGTMLGNYPQAFTHLALIEAALNLDATDGAEALHTWAKDAE